MARILALDTSSEGCSAALINDGHVTSVFEIVPRDHTRKIMPMIKHVLAESDTQPSELTAIAFGCGPGSFTGLRIAAGVTQGLAYGLGINVIPVSTLEAMALEAYMLNGHTKVITAIDARMDEVYWGSFSVSDNKVISLQAERVCKPEQVSLPETIEGLDRNEEIEKTFAGIGSGWQFLQRMPSDVQGSTTIADETLIAKAEYIARIAEYKYAEGHMVPAEQAIPVYLRDTVTWKKLPGR